MELRATRTDGNVVSVSATEARTRFGAVLTAVTDDNLHVIVERNGKPAVAIVSFKDYQEFRRRIAATGSSRE